MQSLSLSAPAVPAAASPGASLAACQGAGLVACQSGRVVVALLALRPHPAGGVYAVLGAGVHGGTVAPVVAVVLPHAALDRRGRPRLAQLRPVVQRYAASLAAAAGSAHQLALAV